MLISITCITIILKVEKKITNQAVHIFPVSSFWKVPLKKLWVHSAVSFNLFLILWSTERRSWSPWKLLPYDHLSPHADVNIKGVRSEEIGISIFGEKSEAKAISTFIQDHRARGRIVTRGEVLEQPSQFLPVSVFKQLLNQTHLI